MRALLRIITASFVFGIPGHVGAAVGAAPEPNSSKGAFRLLDSSTTTITLFGVPISVTTINCAPEGNDCRFKGGQFSPA